MNRNFELHLLIVGLLVAAASGCESDDARLARVSQEAAARQAEQNREIARVVESQQALQQEIDADRGHLDQQRTVLEDERRAIAAERIRDPIIANALFGAVILAACVLPLVLTFFVLRGAHRSEPDDAALSELLVQELVAEEPLLLPRPTLPGLEQQPTHVETVSRAADDL
jgi:thiol:disulfide interchange protein